MKSEIQKHQDSLKSNIAAQFITAQSNQVFDEAGIIKFGESLKKAFNSGDIGQIEFEKGLKDLTKLQKKVITNSQGHQQTVYVRIHENGSEYHFKHDDKVKFDHKGEAKVGTIKGLKHHEKFDPFGTATIHDEAGNKYSKSLRAVEHDHKIGDKVEMTKFHKEGDKVKIADADKFGGGYENGYGKSITGKIGTVKKQKEENQYDVTIDGIDHHDLHHSLLEPYNEVKIDRSEMRHGKYANGDGYFDMPMVGNIQLKDEHAVGGLANLKGKLLNIEYAQESRDKKNIKYVVKQGNDTISIAHEKIVDRTKKNLGQLGKIVREWIGTDFSDDEIQSVIDGLSEASIEDTDLQISPNVTSPEVESREINKLVSLLSSNIRPNTEHEDLKKNDVKDILYGLIMARKNGEENIMSNDSINKNPK